MPRIVLQSPFKCTAVREPMNAISINSHLAKPWTTYFQSYHTPGAPATTRERHQQEVQRIAASVKGFSDRGEKFRIYHGSTNSTRKSALGRDRRSIVDTSSLKHVIDVDAESKSIRVEPNVPMDRLVEETLKYGLIPPVVMEFPGITVGGGYSGTSGESSSFKHGFFDRTINQIEMVLANGKIVTASDTENADLFRGAAGAVGTFGVTTLVDIQLHKATKYVLVTYHKVDSMQEATEKLLEFTSRPSEFDYIDGIMYSPTSGVVITGRMTDNQEGLQIQRFSDAKDPWFYLHVQDRIATGTTSEIIPLTDYLFRYDRGGFWVGAAAFDYMGVPFNNFTRWFLDDFLHTRMLYNALHASGQSEMMIVQDLALPYETAGKFVERMDELVGIWPLWLCPLKQSPHPTVHPHVNAYEADGKTPSPMLNIGLWGKLPPRYPGGFVQANRDIESVLQELGGMKWLYAQTYFSEEDFWKDFNRPWYEALRMKYHAQSLPTVYDKVHVDVEKDKAGSRRTVLDMWPFSGMYGLWRAIQSGDYLQARNPAWKHWIPRS